MTSPYQDDPLSANLRGYRWWRVSPDGWLQSPWFAKKRWEPHDNLARCLARPPQLWPLRWLKEHPNGAPSKSCGCGWYALDDLPRGFTAAFPWEIDPSGSSAQGDLVFGVCEGWGRILIGTQGWRAERARPVALYVPPRLPRNEFSLAVLSRRYDIPVVHDLNALAGEWGPDRQQLNALRAS